MSAVPTVEEARAHLLRWWTYKTVGLVLGVTTVLGVTVEAIALLWVARTRPEWLDAMTWLIVGTVLVGGVGLIVQVALAWRLPRERGVTAKHGQPKRLVIFGVAALMLALVFLGAPLAPLAIYLPVTGLAYLCALGVDRALDDGRIEVAAGRARLGRWLVLYGGTEGRLVVERGDEDAVEATRAAAERDPAVGGRVVWLQHHVLAVLEHEPDPQRAAPEVELRQPRVVDALGNLGHEAAEQVVDLDAALVGARVGLPESLLPTRDRVARREVGAILGVNDASVAARE
ncbi:MAG: hypothetical protein KC621_02630 [Myxococcales bacterium]|nr:hypothetical protein [Myxococcales bacterium]